MLWGTLLSAYSFPDHHFGYDVSPSGEADFLFSGSMNISPASGKLPLCALNVLSMDSITAWRLAPVSPTNLPYKAQADRFSDYLLEFLPRAIEYFFLKHEALSVLCFSLCSSAINKSKLNEWFYSTKFLLKDC